MTPENPSALPDAKRSAPRPTVEFLRSALDYNPATGTFIWRERTWGDSPRSIKSFNSRFAGKLALATPHHHGYLRGLVDGMECWAHRAAWAITHGAWPSELLDHINGDRSDNRIANLRLVDRLGNSRNQKTPITNTSGHIGVRASCGSGRWVARIRSNDAKSLHLGTFDRFEEAVAARKAAERRLGYHENHGRQQ